MVKDIMPEEHRDKFHMDKLFMTDVLFSAEGRLNFDIKTMNRIAEEENCEIISMRNMRLGKHRLNCTLLPYKKLVERFACDYFTDTITYMLAYALYKHSYLAMNPNGVIRLELKKPLTLRLFGIDMVTNIEYQVSKGGVEYWIGIARGLGCEITVSKGSAIMANPRGAPYGLHIPYNVDEVDHYGLLDEVD